MPVPAPKPPAPSLPTPRSRHGLAKRLRQIAIRVALPALIVVFYVLPWRVVLGAGWLLGWLAFVAQPRRRRRARGSLTRCFGDRMSRGELRALERRVFTGLGMNLAELCWAGARPARVDWLVEIEGEEHMRAALARGKGAILLSGHLGSWELVGAALVRRGVPLSVIARRAADEGVNDFLIALRARLGVRTVLRGSVGAARAILRTFRKGEVLATLLDQDTRVDGMFVEFFGRPAYTPTGPIILAMKTGAAVVPGAMWRGPDGRHRGRMDPFVVPEPGSDPAESVGRYTQEFTRWLEERIREHPDQWVWIHRRWRRTAPATSPGAPPD